MDHKGRYTRGYLTHCDFPDSVQAITFRLADSIAKSLLDEWRRAAAVDSTKQQIQADLLRKIAKYEDAGHGECLLREPQHARTVQEQLIAGHGDHYRLIEWCIMPNHVHVLIGMKPGQTLARTVQQWKGASAISINRLSGRNGTFWMRDYFDRFIRDEDHFLNARIYVRKNPVKAGLCTTPEDWPFSSAGSGWIP